jgi:hypothetical protein
MTFGGAQAGSRAVVDKAHLPVVHADPDGQRPPPGTIHP